MHNELLTPIQMARADQLTIAAGTPGIALMEQAGRAIVACVTDICSLQTPVLVFAGPGNNGGDGFVAARLLHQHGFSVTLGLLGERAELSGDAARAAKSWQEESHGKILAATQLNITKDCFIIDAMFGAGLQRPLTGTAADIVARINAAGVPVVAVDLPSGVNGHTGAIEGIAVIASHTVTFFRAKPGHYLLPGRLQCGSLHIAQIGIGAQVLDEITPNLWQNTPDLWADKWPIPSAAAHKFARGHTLGFSGSSHKTGAARMAAAAALRAGSGLVSLASPGSAMMVNANHLTTIMLNRIDTAAELSDLLVDQRYNSMIIGPGCGVGEPTREKVLAALAAGCACTLDADALTSFADDREVLAKAIAARPGRDVVLTPHGGEFARLFPDIAGDDKVTCARNAAAKVGATVVLKGADTVIAAPDGRAAINTNAPPWLATAGSGDILAGFIAGLLAQSMPGFEAAAMGVWLHGAAGKSAGIGLIATDLPDHLPAVFSALRVDLEQG